MNINELMKGKYLKKEDCPSPVLYTIRNFTVENVAQENQPQEMKGIMWFNEVEQGLVMNNTNLQLAAQAFGTMETTEWTGRQIVVYADPTVSFGGKMVGGLRLRGPKKQAENAQQPAGDAFDESQDIPF